MYLKPSQKNKIPTQPKFTEQKTIPTQNTTEVFFSTVQGVSGSHRNEVTSVQVVDVNNVYFNLA